MTKSLAMKWGPWLIVGGTLLPLADQTGIAQVAAEANPAAKTKADQAVDAANSDIPVAQKPAQVARKTVEKLAAEAKQSVVVVSYRGRGGKQQGVGTGFVVSSDGLIATNLHVIGEARPIEVRTADGKRYDVMSVYATERTMDLALIKIDAKNLPALELGDSETLEQGQPVVALGNPHGLEHSVVAGVVSGTRKVDGKPMIQLAIPIEPGNSGGPLLDMQGRVHGILTLKSLVTRNLGFAIAVNALKPLLDKPNPVPMSRWLTIGALDKSQWSQLFGARWRQRAGRILVEGWGTGFGGRSLSLRNADVPGLPFELAVSVRLEAEDGAAGLVFHADEQNRHYGFYPSNERLRLSRFDGPDVYSWKVLKEVRSRHYRPGEWNRLKVRVEENKLQCFVNDELVIESDDAVYHTGRTGLAKFRHTAAEFKGFEVGSRLESSRPSAQLVERVTQIAAGLSSREPFGRELIVELATEAKATQTALREHARVLDEQASQLRALADAVHQQQVHAELIEVLEHSDQEIDLLHAALLIAKLDNRDVDVAAYQEQVDRMVAEVSQSYTEEADAASKLEALDRFLFQDFGFHGSRTNYYHRSNSYLNEVIDDREGLPITLSVLYMELARRMGLKVVGVGLPGHFVVRLEPTQDKGQLIDPFNRGQRLDRGGAEALIKSISGRMLGDADLVAQSKKAILTRILRNLLRVAFEQEDATAMMRYVDTVLLISPESGESHWLRAGLRYRAGRYAEAMEDVQWILENGADGVDPRRVRDLRAILVEEIGKVSK
jgi:S1-C subfamily serine protease/regulator of sirC expression with transglutaminase-like and TPR domain